jgi:hypothetical protein
MSFSGTKNITIIAKTWAALPLKKHKENKKIRTAINSKTRLPLKASNPD